MAKDNILICLSPSVSNVKVIEKAKDLMMDNSNLIALYIASPNVKLDDNQQKQLDHNMALAKQYKADIEIIYADDVVGEIIRYATLYKIKRIVIGKNQGAKKLFKKSLCEEILDDVDDVDIVVVPVKSKKPLPKFDLYDKVNVKDILVSIAVLLICTMVGYFFFILDFHDSNIIMVYILGILIIALMTSNILCSILSSIISVLLFNFCFTFPIMSLSVYDSSYLMTFFIMIIVASLTSTLTNRIQRNAYAASNMAQISNILLETNQIIQKNSSETDIITSGCTKLSELLNRDIVYYIVTNGELSKPILLPNKVNSHIDECQGASEEGVAKWVSVHKKHAGANTHYLSGAKCVYYAIFTSEETYGVIGIYLNNDRLNSFESRILLAVLAEMALSLENIKSIQDKNEAILKVKKEEFRADLLRSISHDLRTPLTSIYGNSDILLSDTGYLSKEKKKILYTNIYDDSLWLINLVENLLSITRIEDGRMQLKIEPQMVEEVISEALEHVSRNKNKYNIQVNIASEFLMADMDARLIIQVIINLIDNAIKYTPIGSNIEIKAYENDGVIYTEIKDDGNGIRDLDKENIFEKFYSLNNSIIDSKRSMGLGLSLCKSIVEAHGGCISVRDNVPHGAIFTFTLPATKINIDEFN